MVFSIDCDANVGRVHHLPRIVEYVIEEQYLCSGTFDPQMAIERAKQHIYLEFLKQIEITVEKNDYKITIRGKL
jgi:hypothetical protein